MNRKIQNTRQCPEPQFRFFFQRYFRDISTIKFHAAYTTIKLFCTQIQDVSTHMIFSTLKSKLLCRYPLNAIPRLEASKMSWKTGFPRPNTQLYNYSSAKCTIPADFLSTYHGVADYSMIEIERYIYMYTLAITRIGTFCDMHLPKVPTVDPPLENSSQPKKFLIK